MLDIHYLRENWKQAEKAIASKGVKADLRELLRVDEKYCETLRRMENQRALKNKATEEIVKADPAKRKKLIEDAKVFDRDADRAQKELDELSSELKTLLEQLPNLPAEDVKIGKDESENEILKTVGWRKDGSYGEGGGAREISFAAKSATELGETLGVIDIERAGKVAGSRFGYLLGGAVFLEFALARYALDRLLADGFVAVAPPVMIKPEMMRSMGYLSRGGEDETYHFTGQGDDFYLVGTSEQSVVPMHAGEILSLESLPLRYVAFSTCFRREAGSYGKDTKGILRVHQFDKLEMVSITTPETSMLEHEHLLELEEELVSGLKLPYRVIKQCTGDLGDPAARTFDIEIWMPGQGRYRETHSTSNTTDFQTRRLNIKYRDSAGKPVLAHVLNGTAFAIGRMIIAILENCQQDDGSVVLPEVLHKYLPAGQEVLKQTRK
jgi:seryl-tRNA synthetase